MATPYLCIDSDVVIDYLRRKSDVLERVLGQYDCAFTAVTVYELEIGLAHSPRQAAALADLLTIVSVLPFNREAAHAAAQVYYDIRERRSLIGVQDTLIAGTCIAHEVPLLTRNVEHYRRIENLAVLEVEGLA